MTVIATAPSHITIDEQGTARIDNSRWKVIHVAAPHRYRSATPAELQQLWPDLTLGQIYAALAYYHDHRTALDSAMDRDEEVATSMRARQGSSSLAPRPEVGE